MSWTTTAPEIKGDWSETQTGERKEAYWTGKYGVYYTAAVAYAITTDNQLCVRIRVNSSRSFGSVGDAWYYKARAIDSDGEHVSDQARVGVNSNYTWYWTTKTNKAAAVTAGVNSDIYGGGGWSEVTINVPKLGNAVYVKVNGAWKEGQMLVKVNGVWQDGTAKINTGGTWK